MVATFQMVCMFGCRCAGSARSINISPTYCLVTKIGHTSNLDFKCPRNQRTHLVYFFRILPKFSVITDFQYRIMWQRIVPGRDTKIRTFSGPFWHFGPDPDQIRNSGPLRLAIQDFDSWTFLGSNGKIKFLHKRCTSSGQFLDFFLHFDLIFFLDFQPLTSNTKSY